MLKIKSRINPTMGVYDVEFSDSEIKEFRKMNINARKSKKERRKLENETKTEDN